MIYAIVLCKTFPHLIFNADGIIEQEISNN